MRSSLFYLIAYIKKILWSEGLGMKNYFSSLYIYRNILYLDKPFFIDSLQNKSNQINEQK